MTVLHKCQFWIVLTLKRDVTFEWSIFVWYVVWLIKKEHLHGKGLGVTETIK